MPGDNGNAATVYDVTSPANTALDTGTLDLVRFSSVLVEWFCSAGTSVITGVDENDAFAGGDWPGPAVAAPAAAVSGAVAIGPGCTTGGSVTLGVGCPLPRRMRFQAGAAGVGNTVRLRIQGRK